MLIFKKKYIKYKNKYLKLKKQIGGTLGTKPCPAKLPSVYECLMNYNCTYKDLSSKIEEENYDYMDFQLQNSKNKQHITVSDLKSRGFDLKSLLKMHFPYDLLTRNFKLREFLEEKVQISDIIHFNLTQIMEENFNLHELKNVWFRSAKELREVGFNLSQLKEVGFDAEKLREAGFNLSQLLEVGFDIRQLREGMFDVCEFLENRFNLSQLKEAGFDVEELRRAGFKLSQLLEVGFNLNQLKKGKFSARELLNKFNLNQLREVGFTTNKLRKEKFNVRELKDAGFNLRQLKEGGFNAQELLEEYEAHFILELGFNTSKLKEAGITIKKLLEIKTDRNVILNAGFHVDELIKNNFTFEELIEAEYCAKELHLLLDLPAKILKDRGYSIIELINAEYSLDELESAEFKKNEIDNAVSLKKKRFTVEELINDKFINEQFTQQELVDAGYFSIEINGNYTYPYAYMNDNLLVFRPIKQKRLLINNDSRIIFLNDYEEAYLKFYSLLKDFVYNKHGNKENINDLKKNWKISLYGCDKDSSKRYKFNEKQFSTSNKNNSSIKPKGLWASEFYTKKNKPYSPWRNPISWIHLTFHMESKTGRPGDCTGFLIFKLADNDRIYHILNLEDKENLDKNIFYNMDEYVYDWEEIAKKYDALNMQCCLNEGWDVSSTVIWNKNAIKEYHFITLEELPFVKNFINCEMLFTLSYNFKDEYDYKPTKKNSCSIM